MIRSGRDESLITHILQNCRARDRQEIECLMPFEVALDVTPGMYEAANWKHIAIAKGQMRPTTFLMFHSFTPVCLAASMIATDEFKETTTDLIRWGLKIFKPQALAQGFKRVECRTLAGHEEAIDFLTRLGFVREADIPDFGRNGETFIQFAWRLSDHVPVLNPKSPGNP